MNMISSIVSNLESYWLNYGRTAHSELVNLPDCAGFSTTVPTPLYNGVIRTQFAIESLDESIQRTINYFAQKQLPFVWWTTPTSEPSMLETALEAHGLIPIMELPGMSIALDTVTPLSKADHLEILTVQDATTLKQSVEVAMIGFDTPTEFFDPLFALESALEMPYTRFLALWNGKPAGISALYLDSGVAGLYFVATIPEARRHGVGMAVTQAALEEARTLGCDSAILQASPMGAPMYERLGFQECCKLKLYLYSPTTPS